MLAVCVRVWRAILIMLTVRVRVCRCVALVILLSVRACEEPQTASCVCVALVMVLMTVCATVYVHAGASDTLLVVRVWPYLVMLLGA